MTGTKRPQGTSSLSHFIGGTLGLGGDVGDTGHLTPLYSLFWAQL